MKVLKILAIGLSGGFSKSPDLQARFVAWIVFTLVLLGAFTFDAWISFSVFADYLSYVGSAGDIPGLILSIVFAAAATVSVGVIAYAFVSYRKSIGKEGVEISDSLRFAGYVAGMLYVFFAGISILANIQGANQAAERHAAAAVPVSDTPLLSTTSEWTSEKKAITARYDTELTEIKQRIASIEAGTSVEQGRVGGTRGNVNYQGKLTKYGRALLADLRSQISEKEVERASMIASLDNTYQTRLSTEEAAYTRQASKQEEKRGRATTAIRFIVFLIYPIGLGISIFNAHFVYDVQDFLADRIITKTTKVKQEQIGFAVGPVAKKTPVNPAIDVDKLKAELRAEMLPILEAELRDKLRGETLNNTGKIESFTSQPASQKNDQNTSKIYLSDTTPYNLGKTYDLSKHEKRQLTKVNRVYMRTINETGNPPSANFIAKETGLAWGTAKKYLDMLSGE